MAKKKEYTEQEREQLLTPTGGLGLLVGLEALYEFCKPISRSRVRVYLPEMRNNNIVNYSCIGVMGSRHNREQMIFFPDVVQRFFREKITTTDDFKSRRGLKVADTTIYIKRCDVKQTTRDQVKEITQADNGDLYQYSDLVCGSGWQNDIPNPSNTSGLDITSDANVTYMNNTIYPDTNDLGSIAHGPDKKSNVTFPVQMCENNPLECRQEMPDCGYRCL